MTRVPRIVRRKSGAFGKRFEEQRGRGGDWIINKSFVCCANDSDVSEEGLGLPFLAKATSRATRLVDRFRVRGPVQW